MYRGVAYTLLSVPRPTGVADNHVFVGGDFPMYYRTEIAFKRHIRAYQMLPIGQRGQDEGAAADLSRTIRQRHLIAMRSVYNHYMHRFGVTVNDLENGSYVYRVTN